MKAMLRENEEMGNLNRNRPQNCQNQVKQQMKVRAKEVMHTWLSHFLVVQKSVILQSRRCEYPNRMLHCWIASNPPSPWPQPMYNIFLCRGILTGKFWIGLGLPPLSCCLITDWVPTPDSLSLNVTVALSQPVAACCCLSLSSVVFLADPPSVPTHIDGT